MAIALVANAAVTNAQDTAAINTTGANLIVIAMVGGNDITASDNKGNTYTELTLQNQGGDKVRLWYCFNPTVGSGHTFHQTWSYECIFAAAFSGVASSPFDQENGAGSASATSLQPGGITPSEDNCLVITGLMAGLTNTLHTVNGGFTITNSINGVNGVNYGGAMAYLIQTTAAAANPTHSWASSVPAALRIASFKGPGGGGGGVTNHFLSVMGVGK